MGSKLRFRKYVKEQEGYLVALIDPEGNIVRDNVANSIDELDEHNEWRVNAQGSIEVPKELKGYGLTIHSGYIEESEGYGKLYSIDEFNGFLKKFC